MEFQGKSLRCQMLEDGIVEMTFDLHDETVNKFNRLTMEEFREVVPRQPSGVRGLKNPHYIYHPLLLRQLALVPGLKFVVLVRDPGAMLEAYHRHRARDGEAQSREAFLRAEQLLSSVRAFPYDVGIGA